MRRIAPSIVILTLCLVGTLPAFAATDAAEAADGARNVTSTSQTVDPLAVVVSIPAQKYMVERIAGDAVSVTVLVKPGADPHSYEPTPAQMRRCAAARLYFTIGVPFEDAWLPRIAGTAPALTPVSTISGFSRLRYEESMTGGNDTGGNDTGGNDHERQEAPAGNDTGGNDHERQEAPGDRGHGDHERGAVDPHVWLSPMLARQMLPVISKELCKALPDRAAEFRENARLFSDELEALDREIAGIFAPFAPERRIFLTFHPSWGYFARKYQLRECSIEVEGKEPGPRTMKAVVDLARKHGITTIFVEPQFSAAAASAIADSVKASIVVIDPLAEDLPALYRDVAHKLALSFRHQKAQ